MILDHNSKNKRNFKYHLSPITYPWMDRCTIYVKIGEILLPEKVMTHIKTIVKLIQPSLRSESK